MKRYSITDIDNMDGHSFESFCSTLLLNSGFERTKVTPGSGDQGIDVIGFKDDIMYGIQCKCYSSDVGNKAVQEAYSGKEFYNCHVGAVLTNQYFTASAKELAKKNRVLLWDRDYLINLMKKADAFRDANEEPANEVDAKPFNNDVSEDGVSADNWLSEHAQSEPRPKNYMVVLSGFLSSNVWKDSSYRSHLRKKIAEIIGKPDEEAGKLMVDLPKQIATDLELEQARQLAYELRNIGCIVEIQQPDEWLVTEKKKIDQKLNKAHREVKKLFSGFVCGIFGLIIGGCCILMVVSRAIEGEPIPISVKDVVIFIILSAFCVLYIVFYMQSVHTVNNLLKEKKSLDNK